MATHLTMAPTNEIPSSLLSASALDYYNYSKKIKIFLQIFHKTQFCQILSNSFVTTE